MQALARTPDMRIPLSGFEQSKIDNFSFEDLDRTHQAAVPVLRSLFKAVVQPIRVRSIDSALETLAGDALDSDNTRT